MLTFTTRIHCIYYTNARLLLQHLLVVFVIVNDGFLKAKINSVSDHLTTVQSQNLVSFRNYFQNSCQVGVQKSNIAFGHALSFDITIMIKCFGKKRIHAILKVQLSLAKAHETLLHESVMV